MYIHQKTKLGFKKKGHIKKVPSQNIIMQPITGWLTAKQLLKRQQLQKRPKVFDLCTPDFRIKLKTCSH